MKNLLIFSIVLMSCGTAVKDDAMKKDRYWNELSEAERDSVDKASDSIMINEFTKELSPEEKQKVVEEVTSH